VAESRESQFQALLADAQEDPDVLGVFLFGSRSREGFVDERSDYDIGVVVTVPDEALHPGCLRTYRSRLDRVER
jgi:predicted nucleotidyltransferase